MKVYIAAAEAVPFAKVGGLADVVSALAKELARLGHEITVFLPRPAGLTQERFANLRIEPVAEAVIRLGEGRESARFDRIERAGQEYGVVVVSNDRLMGRPNPYIDPETGCDWPDNAERFVFFCRAVVEAVGLWEDPPDLIHLNDHHTGLVPILLREKGKFLPSLRETGLLFAIHNMGYQGIYPPERILPLLDPETPERHYGPNGPLEFFGNVNFMKAGILYADVITTVSERYAEEIQLGEEHGFGLEGILTTRSANVIGILNGIDVEIWNPEVDPLIPHNYSASNLGPKRSNKARLLQAMELPEETDVPLIGMISRLVDQKGLDLLESAAERLMGMNLSLVVLGNGQPKYEELMQRLRLQYPDRFATSQTFNEPLAHLIEAGSDFFLMPSKYEPCGLNQMYSLRYGTIPIVRATGGLADTVCEYDPATGRGNGFRFEEYSAEAMLDAVRRGLVAYGRSRAWKKLVTTVMRIDHSWARAARAYVEAYRRAAASRQ